MAKYPYLLFQVPKKMLILETLRRQLRQLIKVKTF